LTPNAIRVEPGLRPSELRAGAWNGWVLREVHDVVDEVRDIATASH
jgi:hypothetical protein